MITFVNNTDTVEVIVDNSDIPPQYTPDYTKAYIRKANVSMILIDLSGDFISVFFSSGKPYQLSYEFIDAQHSCSNNEDLYDLLKTYFS